MLQIKRLVTQDSIDFDLFVTKLTEKIRQNPKKWEKCSEIVTHFYTVKDEDFERMTTMIDSKFDYPKCSDHKTSQGFITRDILRKTGFDKNEKVS